LGTLIRYPTCYPSRNSSPNPRRKKQKQKKTQKVIEKLVSQRLKATTPKKIEEEVIVHNRKSQPITVTETSATSPPTLRCSFAL
jgi:hypothetical protein